jgi:hypothetical protein
MNCVVCDKELIGNQTKYCCSKCKGRGNYKLTYGCQQDRGLARKIYFIKLLGGGCSVCGYRKNISALAFHHTKEKEFNLDKRMMSAKNISVLENEVRKCILLCNNCHSELHNPQLEIEGLQERIDNNSIESKTPKKNISVCKLCGKTISKSAKVCSECYSLDREKIRTQIHYIPKEDIIEMFKTKNISEIHRETGISNRRISKILREAGFETRLSIAK